MNDIYDILEKHVKTNLGIDPKATHEFIFNVVERISDMSTAEAVEYIEKNIIEGLNDKGKRIVAFLVRMAVIKIANDFIEFNKSR
ncbi:MAG: hypothetical protein JSW06_02920 [Thermoplasmatales archaeon]|nr:MAG: hypothetical protein JSW06_02920 [Thermoplasmatales archaeon]